MNLSPEGLARLKRLEGCVLTPYRDSAGVWTDGFGNTNGVVPHGPAITPDKADADLLANVQGAVDAVNRLVTVALNQNQFDALVLFAFNVGVAAFGGSTLLRQLNAGVYVSVPLQLARWNKVTVDGQHQVSKGLTLRRAVEAALWQTPVVATPIPTPAPAPSPGPVTTRTVVVAPAPKYWLTSKTMIVSILTAIAGLSAVLSPYTTELQELLGPHWYGYVLMVIGVAQGILRGVTGTPVTMQRTGS